MPGFFFVKSLEFQLIITIFDSVIGTTLYIALLTVTLGVDNRWHYHEVTDEKLPGCEVIIENQSCEIGTHRLQCDDDKRELFGIHSTLVGCRWVKVLHWLLTTEFYEVAPKDDHQLHPRKERPDT